MKRSVLLCAIWFVAVGCGSHLDLAPDKPESEVSVFHCKSVLLTRVDQNTPKGFFNSGWSDVRMPPGDHDLSFELGNGPNSATYGWNLRHASEAGHHYTANGTGMSGLLVGGTHAWLTIKDDTTGAEMKVQH